MKNALIISAAILAGAAAISYAEQAPASKLEPQCGGSSTLALHLDLPKLYVDLAGAMDHVGRVGCLNLNFRAPTVGTAQ